jgi:hypothetical protein
MNISIFATFTESYCGGAAPPDFLLRELATPKPLSETEIFIRQGTENDVTVPILTSAKTDKDGLVQFTLLPGDYLVVLTDKKDDRTYNEILQKYSQKTDYTDVVDKQCLDRWLATPEIVLHVKERSPNTFRLNIHKPCPWESTPCVQYISPLLP